MYSFQRLTKSMALWTTARTLNADFFSLPSSTEAGRLAHRKYGPTKSNSLCTHFVITKDNAKDNLPVDFYVNAPIPRLQKHIIVHLTLLKHFLRGVL